MGLLAVYLFSAKAEDPIRAEVSMLLGDAICGRLPVAEGLRGLCAEELASAQLGLLLSGLKIVGEHQGGFLVKQELVYLLGQLWYRLEAWLAVPFVILDVDLRQMLDD